MEGTIYDWEYFANKTPFKKTLEKFADLEIYSHWYGSTGNRYYHYTIHYNQRKFVENVTEIKKALLKTKMCKHLDWMRKKVEAIPDSLEGFENACAINGAISDLVTQGCMRQGNHSIRYEWHVAEKYQEDMEFNKACAAKMKRPLLKLHEVNGWERESWNFYVDYTTDELFVRLAERLKNMPKIRQCNGDTYFVMNLVPHEYDRINWTSHTGYMHKNNLIEGTLDRKKMEEILNLSDDGLFEAMYKGGLRYLFK